MKKQNKIKILANELPCEKLSFLILDLNFSMTKNMNVEGGIIQKMNEKNSLFNIIVKIPSNLKILFGDTQATIFNQGLE